VPGLRHTLDPADNHYRRLVTMDNADRLDRLEDHASTSDRCPRCHPFLFIRWPDPDSPTGYQEHPDRCPACGRDLGKEPPVPVPTWPDGL